MLQLFPSPLKSLKMKTILWILFFINGKQTLQKRLYIISSDFIFIIYFSYRRQHPNWFITMVDRKENEHFPASYPVGQWSRSWSNWIWFKNDIYTTSQGEILTQLHSLSIYCFSSSKAITICYLKGSKMIVLMGAMNPVDLKTKPTITLLNRPLPNAKQQVLS